MHAWELLFPLDCAAIIYGWWFGEMKEHVVFGSLFVNLLEHQSVSGICKQLMGREFELERLWMKRLVLLINIASNMQP